jgi:hypothetical protein
MKKMHIIFSWFAAFALFCFVTDAIADNCYNFEAEHMPSIIGSNHQDSSGVWRRATEWDGDGYMVYGPYINLPKGDFCAIYKLRINNAPSGGVVARLDINDFTGGHICLGSQDIRTGGQANYDVPVCFHNEYSDHLLEFRVYSFGNATVDVDRIMVCPN